MEEKQKPRGEIPKHIMEGVIDGIDKADKTDHGNDMSTTQIPQVKPEKPATDTVFFSWGSP